MNRKRIIQSVALVALLGLGLTAKAATPVATVEAALGSGTGTYLDIGPSDSNNGLTGTWYNYTGGGGGEWGYPDTSDSGTSVNGNCLDDKGNSTPEVTFVVTGLSNSTVYSLWVVAVEPANNPGNSDFSWGTTSGALSNEFLTSGTAIVPISGSTAGLRGVNVGAVTSDVTGSVTIYLDNGTDFSDPDYRTELDGVLLEPFVSGVFSLSFSGDGDPIASGATNGTPVGVLTGDLDGAPVATTFSLVSGQGDSDSFAIAGGSNLVVNADLTSVTNGQNLSIYVEGTAAGQTVTNVFTLVAYEDADLNGLNDAYTVITTDDFSSDTTGDYTYSVVRDDGSVAEPTISVTGGVLDYAGQVDNQGIYMNTADELAVGETLFVDILDIPTGNNQRKGLALCATTTLPAPTGGDFTDTRSNLLYFATDANSSKHRWLCQSDVDGTETTFTSSSFTSWSQVKALYIARTDVDQFKCGWVGFDLGMHQVYTVTSAAFGSHCYIGLNTETIGTLNTQFDNLTLAYTEVPYAFTLSNGDFISGNPIGTVIGTLSASENGAPAPSTFTLVSGDGTNDADNAKFSIDGDQLKVNYDFTGAASTNGQHFAVRIKGDTGSSSATNSYSLRVVFKDDNLDGILDTWVLLSGDTFDSFNSGDWTFNNLLQQVAGTVSMASVGGELEVAMPSHGVTVGAVRSASLYQPETMNVDDCVYLDVDTTNFVATNIEERVGLVVSLDADPVDATLGGSGSYTNVAFIAFRPGYGQNVVAQNWDNTGAESTFYQSTVTASDIRSLYVERATETRFAFGWVTQSGIRHEIYQFESADFDGQAAYYGIWSDARTPTYKFYVDNLNLYATGGVPALVATPAGSDLQLSWPVKGGSGYSVMSRANLISGSWSDAGLTPVSDGTNNVVTIPVGGTSSQFYRLQR